ncbi:hypothetical protein CDD83_4873 [Cordyceps sp. RAO-2017]|nr:hypothetical protein CDD83_4873 [Cordyceps sp. RAO-2017]
MERQTTTPPPPAQPRAAASPPMPERTRRIEESRLRAKALREQREAEQRAAGTEPWLPKTSAGFVPTDEVHVSKSVTGKRPYEAMAGPASAGTNRDGRSRGGDEGGALRPAPKFAKFVDYNMSAMTDTKGGFLSLEDDPHNYALGTRKAAGGEEQRPKHMTMQDWERQQLLRTLRRQKAGPFEPGLSVLEDEATRKRCRECRSFEIDFVWEEVFHLCVCNKCKEAHPDKYSLLTKTECKQDYLLTDPELRDPELLPHLSRPNPHKSHWHDMMLFLRLQVEEYALKSKWGSAEALDAEYERREAQKKARKDAKFKEKLMDLKRKTRTDAFRRQAGTLGKTGASKFGDAIGGQRHVHEWGRTVENDEGLTVKTCLGCGMEVEELEL